MDLCGARLRNNDSLTKILFAIRVRPRLHCLCHTNFRSLRQQIALHRNEAAPSIERQVDEKTAACNGLKRQLDGLRHEVAQKKDILDKNRGKLDELTGAANSQNMGSSSQMVRLTLRTD